MFTEQVEVLIARPPNEVFAFVEDARNRPRWDDSVDNEELTSAEPIGVGTTVRTRLRSMGREYEYNWEVREHEPPSWRVPLAGSPLTPQSIPVGVQRLPRPLEHS